MAANSYVLLVESPWAYAWFQSLLWNHPHSFETRVTRQSGRRGSISQIASFLWLQGSELKACWKGRKILISCCSGCIVLLTWVIHRTYQQIWIFLSIRIHSRILRWLIHHLYCHCLYILYKASLSHRSNPHAKSPTENSAFPRSHARQNPGTRRHDELLCSLCPMGLHMITLPHTDHWAIQQMQ